MSSNHSRNGSADTTTSNSSAYHFILEHILSYPETYDSSTPNRQHELPLRSMYTLNSAAPALSGASTPHVQSTNSSPILPKFPQSIYDTRSVAQAFKSSIMDQIAQLPQQPASLPPAFVTEFLKRIFTENLEMVDFPQALTALDYLKELESRRRKEIASALKHHGVDRTALDSAQGIDDLAAWYPTVGEWVRSLESKEKRADALYTQLYVSLRRWILTNEMMLIPFSKNNCHAMLNTLYPPLETTQPTSKLTIPLLTAQREGFFNYIKTVEKTGTKCLDGLMEQGKREGEANGWPAVRRTLMNYLKLTNALILEAQNIRNQEPQTFINRTPEIPPPASPTRSQRGDRTDRVDHVERKTDSGVSFGDDGQEKMIAGPGNRGSGSSGGSGLYSGSSSKSISNSRHTSSSFDFSTKGSTLERLARELKRMRPRKMVVEEIVKEAPESVQERSKASKRLTKVVASPVAGLKEQNPSAKTRFASLRKMKSLTALADLKHSNGSSMSLRRASKVPPFDVEAMRKQREEYERRNFI